MIALPEIQEARQRIGDSTLETPCPAAPILGRRCGVDLFFKLESLQVTGSFKARGALNRLLTLSEEERERGVVAASAGNHAQGVAYAAGRVGASAHIVMPETTPLIKVSRTRELGAEVEIWGATFEEAYQRALELKGSQGHTLIHPFEDDAVVAGQGTAGLEILEQVPDVEVVVVPVGGGGLIAGIATALKESRSGIRVYGVQSEASPAMQKSFVSGKLTLHESLPSIAEGISVKRPGAKTFEVIRERVDGMVLVSEDAIEEGIFELLETGKIVAEGAGAAAFAALLAGRLPEAEGRRVVVVVSGANIDLNVLSRIIERSLVKQHRIVRLRIMITDRPGALAALLAIVAREEVNVLRIHHNRIFAAAAFWETEVELTLETRDRAHIDTLLDALRRAGYPQVREQALTRVAAPAPG